MKEFYILSLKWSKPIDDKLTWWGPNNGGYFHYLEHAGKYTEKQIKESPEYYNNKTDTVAVPIEDADKMSHRIVPYGNWMFKLKKELGLK